MITISTITSLDELVGKDALERSKLFLGDFNLLATITHNDDGDPLVPAGHYTSEGILVRPFWEDAPDDMEGEAYQSYIAAHPGFTLSMRRGVAERLVAAQRALPNHWAIVLKAGFRPLPVQTALFEKAHAYLQEKHPDWDAAKVLHEARILVSDPRVKIPPHSTGAAIDIEVLDTATGKLVDMGAPANTDGPAGWTYSHVISDEQQERRIILLKAMLHAGFANFAFEWWHFSYGDAMWALFYEQQTAPYHLIKEE